MTSLTAPRPPSIFTTRPTACSPHTTNSGSSRVFKPERRMLETSSDAVASRQLDTNAATGFARPTSGTMILLAGICSERSLSTTAGAFTSMTVIVAGES